MTKSPSELRRKQIEEAADFFGNIQYTDYFIAGAEWADSTNPYKQLCEEMAEALNDSNKDNWRSLCQELYFVVKDYIGHEDYPVEKVETILRKYEAMKNDLCRTPPV